VCPSMTMLGLLFLGFFFLNLEILLLFELLRLATLESVGLDIWLDLRLPLALLLPEMVNELLLV
jgi:hypothetical protein